MSYSDFLKVPTYQRNYIIDKVIDDMQVVAPVASVGAGIDYHRMRVVICSIRAFVVETDIVKLIVPDC